MSISDLRTLLYNSSINLEPMLSKHSIALRYFANCMTDRLIEWMRRKMCEYWRMPYCLLSVIVLCVWRQGYRVSAEQQISAAVLSRSGLDSLDLETLRDAALSIYNQYLSEKVLLTSGTLFSM